MIKSELKFCIETLFWDNLWIRFVSYNTSIAPENEAYVSYISVSFSQEPTVGLSHQ